MDTKLATALTHLRGLRAAMKPGEHVVGSDLSAGEIDLILAHFASEAGLTQEGQQRRQADQFGSGVLRSTNEATRSILNKLG